MEIEIIDFVRQHRILYEPQFRRLMYKETKDTKWMELAQKLNVPTEAVKKRWKTLRDRYCRDKKAMDCGEKIGPWKYAKYLDFLSNVQRFHEYGAEYYADCDVRNESGGEGANETTEYIGKMDYETVVEIEAVDQSINKVDEEASFESVYLNEQKPNFADIHRNNTLTRRTSTNQTNSQSNSAQNNDNITSCPKKAAALALLPRRTVVPLTPTRAFFNSLAMQIDEANLPNVLLFTLQRKIMNVVHQAILDMEQNLGGEEEHGTPT